jgi:hypothetical protein
MRKRVRYGYHFFSAAGQFVSNVMEVDLVWSAVCTANRLPLGLTSKPMPVKFGRSNWDRGGPLL